MPSAARLLPPHLNDVAAERSGLMALTKHLAVSRGNGQCRSRPVLGVLIFVFGAV